MNKDEKRVVCVTGSSHGIGESIVLELAKIGFSVVINEETATKLPKEYIKNLTDIYENDVDNQYLYVRADISKKEDRQVLINKIKEKFNRILNDSIIFGSSDFRMWKM